MGTYRHHDFYQAIYQRSARPNTAGLCGSPDKCGHSCSASLSYRVTRSIQAPLRGIDLQWRSSPQVLFGRKTEELKKTRPPIFRTAPILIKMSLFIPVGLAVCFSVGPILSSTLIYIEIRNVRASPYVSEYDYRWEKIAGIVVGIISIGLGIAGIVAVATVSYSREEIYYWLDGVVMCNLQILVSHNVRQPA